MNDGNSQTNNGGWSLKSAWIVLVRLLTQREWNNFSIWQDSQIFLFFPSLSTFSYQFKLPESLEHKINPKCSDYLFTSSSSDRQWRHSRHNRKFNFCSFARCFEYGLMKIIINNRPRRRISGDNHVPKVAVVVVPCDFILHNSISKVIISGCGNWKRRQRPLNHLFLLHVSVCVLRNSDRQPSIHPSITSFLWIKRSGSRFKDIIKITLFAPNRLSSHPHRPEHPLPPPPLSTRLFPSQEKKRHNMRWSVM